MKDTATQGARMGGTRWHWVILLLVLALPVRGQWVTQTLALKAGWNAVYLHVDPSHGTLADLVGADANNPVMEVWMWAPPVSTVQFVTSPQEPLPENSQWRYWNRSTGEGSLSRMVGNAAYLVRVSADVATYEWQLKGKPMAPAYDWTTTGLNFVGFPTVSTNAPTWEMFLSYAPELQLNAEVYQYNGGDLGAGNPSRLYAYRAARVQRGKAFWIRSGKAYNRYFTPFELVGSAGGGVGFNDALSATSFRLKNLTTSNLTIRLGLVASETPPAGQPSVAGVPPLLLRGALDTSTLVYGYSVLGVNSPQSVTLTPQGQPGSDVEVVVGLNRAAMSGNEGDSYAAVLRLTDSLGIGQVDVPVTATVASSSGLWVGDAVVNYVDPYIPVMDRMVLVNASPVDTNAPTVGSTTSNSIPANVPRTVPLRLIVHNPGVGGNACLLQRVFAGVDAATNRVISTTASVLHPSYMADARRLSAAHLPWTATNQVWAFDGRIGSSTNLRATVRIAASDHGANPFLHTYHPDHDNLDPTFRRQLPQGMESYAITRNISLEIQPPAAGFQAITGSRQTVYGTYLETLTLSGLARAGGTNDTRTFTARGTFSLNRIDATPVLTVPSKP